jgi:hypothetical protein
MGLIASMMLPPKPKTDDPDEKRLLNVVGWGIQANQQAEFANKMVDRIGSFAARKLSGTEDEQELEIKKTKLEIEMMRRQLGQYRDDDKYEKQLNRDEGGSLMNAALVSRKAHTYAERGRKLADFIIGDVANDSIFDHFRRLRRKL